MVADPVRLERNRRAIREAGFGGLVCALPSNVLLLTGYFPVVATSIALATSERTLLLVPEDEEDLARASCADEVQTFQAASLKWIKPLPDVIGPSLGRLLSHINVSSGAIGYEETDWVQPASYAAMHLFGGAMRDLLSRLAPGASFKPAKACLESLRLIKTPAELDRIRAACGVAGRAFAEGIGHVRPGRTETQIAAAFRGPLLESPQDWRADGFAFCMSGPNGAQAYKAFQRSTGRELRDGDLVLAHCNSHVGGYWTDITRTYTLGQPTERTRRMYQAVFAAREAALNAVKPRARAADVDRAARDVMRSFGFADQFVHPTGHGVGFAAIDHNARPRLHPVSDEILQEGMVFNVEPGIYFKGECGMRHCDMVAVTSDGHELLTPFQDRPELLAC
ncbi:MAG TPA: Xaa-Pro peptidase family protein [Tepidisphaeraceae bacterium]|nr:Xaa-Pro peptidase family protein [Tepidisphaeraceae bacterium]